MGADEQYSYTPAQVARLLGFDEGDGYADERHVTALDILSWKHDPGGDPYYYFVAVQNETAKTAWMARRGPLDPNSDAAAMLADLLMALNRLPLFQKAVVSLHLAGLDQTEIAEVLHTRQPTVSRILLGRPKRGADGEAVRDENDLTVYTGGIHFRIARLMNGRKR